MKIAFAPSQEVFNYVVQQHQYDFVLSNKRNLLKILKTQKEIIHFYTWGFDKKIAKENAAWLNRNNIQYVNYRIEEGLYRSYLIGQAPQAIYENKGDFLYYHRFEKNNLNQLLDSNWKMSITDEKIFVQAKQIIHKYHLSKYNELEDFIQFYETNLVEISQDFQSFLKKEIHLLKQERFNDDVLIGRKNILLIDQTFEDSSIAAGQADIKNFELCILESLLQAQNGSTVFAKLHPQTLLGNKKGYFPLVLSKLLFKIYQENKNFVLNLLKNRGHNVVFFKNIPKGNTDEEMFIFWKKNHDILKFLYEKLGLYLIEENKQILTFFKYIDQVRVITSQVGFEALLFDKQVICYGAPFYAYYGNTIDRQHNLMQKNRNVAEIFIGLNLYCTKYYRESQEIDLLKHLHLLSLQKRHHIKEKLLFFKTKLWKKDTLDDFSNQKTLFSHQEIKDINNSHYMNYRIATWGFRPEMYEFNYPICMVEDGFIRSVGLGSNLTKPISLVFDKMGIYFNPHQSSSLENMIENERLTDYEYELSKKLMTLLIQKKMTKYNVGIEEIPIEIKNKDFILVLGQVEDDASIEFGKIDVHTNLSLLKKVAEKNPNKKIVFKNHPDVISGNRKGLVSLENIKKINHVDIINVDPINVVYLLENCSELHVITSTAGLEALIRGKKVYTYGGAFYSGYGLTEDQFDFNQVFKRKRKIITLEEFIAFSYLFYPMYKSDKSHEYIDAIDAIEHIDKDKKIIKIEKNTIINQIKRRGIFCLKTIQAIMK